MQTINIYVYAVIAGSSKHPMGHICSSINKDIAASKMVSERRPGRTVFVKREVYSVTMDQIRDLEREAAAAGDMGTARICHVAQARGAGKDALRNAARAIWWAKA